MLADTNSMTNGRVVNIKMGVAEVYIGRGSPFGNPFKTKTETERNAAIELYATYFYERINNDPEFKAKVLALKGKVLGCFCAPKKCHGDVILKYLESME